MINGQTFNTFISYRGSSSGGLLGALLYSELCREPAPTDGRPEIRPFFAPRTLPKGDDFAISVQDVLEDTLCFVAVLTPGFFDACENDDDQVKAEFVAALANPNIKFLPVAMEGYNLGEEPRLEVLFGTEHATRLKHLNVTTFHNIYDTDVSQEVVSRVRDILDHPPAFEPDLRFNLDDFHPVLEHKVVAFGEWPNRIASPEEALSQQVSSGGFMRDRQRGWLIGTSKKYAHIVENHFNKGTFESGQEISQGSFSYYAVEPIKWQVLFENDAYEVLMAERPLDAMPFKTDRLPTRDDIVTAPANSWEYSNVRKWLNHRFLFDAFTSAEIEMIAHAEIPNGKGSWYHSTSEAHDTVDQVFLVSHAEIYAYAEAVGTKDFGCGRPTDYARARGAYASTSSSHDGCGDWWTRSPGNEPDSAENVDRRGCIPGASPFCNYVDDTAASVRPMLVRRK